MSNHCVTNSGKKSYFQVHFYLKLKHVIKGFDMHRNDDKSIYLQKEIDSFMDDIRNRNRKPILIGWWNPPSRNNFEEERAPSFLWE